MKTNIKMVNYNGDIITDYNKSSVSSVWYKWDEHCDCCGADCHHRYIMESKAPDINEADFCIDCMKYFSNHNISYNEAAKLHRPDIYK